MGRQKERESGGRPYNTSRWIREMSSITLICSPGMDWYGNAAGSKYCTVHVEVGAVRGRHVRKAPLRALQPLRIPAGLVPRLPAGIDERNYEPAS